LALRFFFDECVDEDIAAALTSLGIDVLTASAAGRKGLSDQDQLGFARQENRVVYTVDDDFLCIAAAFQARGQSFAGIVYHEALARTKRQVIDALVLCNGVYEPTDMENHIEFV
jgi:hypothetical protein